MSIRISSDCDPDPSHTSRVTTSKCWTSKMTQPPPPPSTGSYNPTSKRTPPPLPPSKGSHYPRVPHSRPPQYPGSAYYSTPNFHQPNSAPGVTLPPVAYSEGRDQPASSSYSSHNASGSAHVYEIPAPPPFLSTFYGSQHPSQLPVHHSEPTQYSRSSSSSPHNHDIYRDADVDLIKPSPPPRSYHNTDSIILDGSEPRSYLEDAEKSAEAVQKSFYFLKFNNKQCTYLCDKLCAVIQSARSFLEVSERKEVGTTSRKDDTDIVRIFKLLMVSGKQIENFVEGCCKDNWIQAAMVLTNVSGYVSSLSFNLHLCEVALGKDHAGSGCLTADEIDGMKKSEAEVVEVKAREDTRVLIEEVVLSLNSLKDEDRDLASYLLQRLLKIKRKPSSGSGSTPWWSKLFDLVKPGQKLGRGASATVYAATWLGTGVAMKKFDGAENADFEKESWILSRLCHPNITSMFCFTKTARNCLIVMELMDGDFKQLMDDRCPNNCGDSRPFPILEAVDIMLQIGEGVKYLHNEGIVHRDLKSGNILYKSVKGKNDAIGYLHVKVADFGISKARDTNTTDSDLTRNTGTNRWMPPEVIGMSDGNQSGTPKHPFKLDSYSFGLLCYEILVGREPFWEFQKVKEIKRRILKKERPILPCDPSECPVMLKTLIEKCWSHEPEERPTFDVICRELTYVKYSLMTGGSMMHGVVDCRIGEKIGDGKAAMSESGHLDSRRHFEPVSQCMPSSVALVASEGRGKIKEVSSRSLQLSGCISTSADYLTLPLKNSMDNSPSSHDSLTSSPNFEGRSNLHHLKLSVEVGHVTCLTTSDMERLGGVEQLSVVLGELRGLMTLDLGGCKDLQHLPVEIGQSTSLTTLVLKECERLKMLPVEIGKLKGLTKLDLGGCRELEELPAEIGLLTNLTTLNLWRCGGLQQLPAEIGQLTGLTTLNLSGCGGLQYLPVEICQLINLMTLDLRGCGGLQLLPAQIGQLTGLMTLWLTSSEGLEQLPAEIGQLIGLTTLELWGSRGLQQLPAQIGQLTSLTTLKLWGCEGLQHLPVEIGQLTCLTTLKLWGCEGLQQLPAEIGQLIGLTTLELWGCGGLQQLPPQIGQLTSLATLKLRECEGLQQLPDEIGQLTYLTTLDLSGCEGLQYLPVEIGQLTNLMTLDMGGCRGLQQLPAEIGHLTGLMTLWLTSCRGLEQLPTEIGQLASLTTLELRGCGGLQQLPAQIGQLTSLTTLKLWGCEGLQQLPAEIGKLTSLTTLTLWQCEGLQLLPAEIGQLKDLTTLELWGCGGLQQVPAQIGQLTSLMTLKLWRCEGLQQLPTEIGQLKCLTTLDLSGCEGLQQLPVELGQLTSLRTLVLKECKCLKQLPVEIGQLTSLTTLDLSKCEGLQLIPAKISQLAGLMIL